jgi:cation-transporting ATPase 13A2
VELTSIPKLLILEALNPFYVFQIFSIALWFSDYYYYYAAAILLMSIVGIASTVYQTRQNQARLRQAIVHSSIADLIEVARGQNTYEMIPTESLVPGDVIVIPSQGQIVMNCDAVLLKGNCIVNESMLTGESVPVTKTPMPEGNNDNEKYNSKEHGRHTLFAGTKIIQTRYYGEERVHAVVIRTGKNYFNWIVDLQ